MSRAEGKYMIKVNVVDELVSVERDYRTVDIRGQVPFLYVLLMVGLFVLAVLFTNFHA